MRVSDGSYVVFVAKLPKEEAAVDLPLVTAEQDEVRVVFVAKLSKEEAVVDLPLVAAKQDVFQT